MVTVRLTLATLEKIKGGIDYAALGMSRSDHHYYNLAIPILSVPALASF